MYCIGSLVLLTVNDIKEKQFVKCVVREAYHKCLFESSETEGEEFFDAQGTEKFKMASSVVSELSIALIERIFSWFPSRELVNVEAWTDGRWRQSGGRRVFRAPFHKTKIVHGPHSLENTPKVWQKYG